MLCLPIDICSCIIVSTITSVRSVAGTCAAESALNRIGLLTFPSSVYGRIAIVCPSLARTWKNMLEPCCKSIFPSNRAVMVCPLPSASVTFPPRTLLIVPSKILPAERSPIVDTSF